MGLMGGTVRFVVPGRPRPQGSKRAFVNKHTGRARMVEQSPHIGDWRARVAHEAALAAGGNVFDGVPLRVTIWCVFARPKSHFRTGRNAHLVKDGADHRPITRSTGDADKLARGILDSLTGTLIADDSLVVNLHIVCSYGGPERVEVSVCDLSETLAGLAAAGRAA